MPHNAPAQTNPLKVAVIGAGPAGLMAAETLAEQGYQVEVFDAMPSCGRKFLMAGKGGLNISHAEAFELFCSRYGASETRLKDYLGKFDPKDICAWMESLGVDWFSGSSGRIFPREMKAAPLLRNWLHRLRQRGVRFHMRHRWEAWKRSAEKWEINFDTTHGQSSYVFDAVVFSLGGGSWPQLGSNGAWLNYFAQQGIKTQTLRPANCGFERSWSEAFKRDYAGQALKTISLTWMNSAGIHETRRGELTVSEYGMEGGLIYAASASLREQIRQQGSARIVLDLLPDIEASVLKQRLSQSRAKDSISNILRKQIKLGGAKLALLKECTAKSVFYDMDKLSQTIKALPIEFHAPRPLAEAISSAGGVDFASVNDNLMLRNFPGLFCAGEMLDWEAPTGGYLLTACLATGRQAGLGVLDWFSRRES